MLYLAEDGLAGVDEVGRGPLAGPVVAAAVCLPQDHGIEDINDSKKLTANQREVLAVEIKSCAAAWCIAEASVDEIDEHNILWASMLAMQRAVNGLSVTPKLVRVDGNRAPSVSVPTQTIVKGDQKDINIAAASILAKVERDNLMRNLHIEYPDYKWDSNKGYPTRAHVHALSVRGVSPHHRRSFAPVRHALNGIGAGVPGQ